MPHVSGTDGGCVAVRAPAKINLFLAVRGLRDDDGFHELVTVLQTTSVYDRVVAGLVGPPSQGHHPAARRRMGLELRAGGDHDGLPASEQNLAIRAARMLGGSTGVLDVTAADNAADSAEVRTVLSLEKAIPVAGGMAGGSADAAATLLALNELWGCELGREQLRELAAELGSDVPFCLLGGTALATGRGTNLVRVLCRGTFHWVVGISAEPLPTAEVFAAWDRHCAPSTVEPDAVLAALRTEDPEALGAALHNDLQPAAFHLRPELAERHQALLDAGALGAVLSGSGPSILGLAADAEHAATLADRVRRQFAATVCTRSPVGAPEVSSC